MLLRLGCVIGMDDILWITEEGSFLVSAFLLVVGGDVAKSMSKWRLRVLIEVFEVDAVLWKIYEWLLLVRER